MVANPELSGNDPPMGNPLIENWTEPVGVASDRACCGATVACKVTISESGVVTNVEFEAASEVVTVVIEAPVFTDWTSGPTVVLARKWPSPR